MSENETPTGTVTGQETLSQETTRTFTQDQINAAVAEERRKVQAKYADYDDLKTAADKLKGIEEAQKTEQQKLQDKLTAAETAAQTAQTNAHNALIRAAVISEAAKAGFVDPSDAVALVDKSKITIKGDEVEGAEAAIKALADSKPHLIKKAGSAATLGATNPAGNGGSQGIMDWHPLYKPLNETLFGGKPKK